MTKIIWVLHLDNGEKHEFEALEWEISFIDDDLSEEKCDELFDELDKIIVMA